MKAYLLCIVVLATSLVLHSCKSAAFSSAVIFEVAAGKSPETTVKAESLDKQKPLPIPEETIISVELNEEEARQLTYFTSLEIPENLDNVNLIKETSDYNISKPATTRPEKTVAHEPIQYSYTSGLAIASLVLGILSIVLLPFIAFFVAPLSLLAIIFGGVSMGKIARSEGRLNGRGLAVAGLVMGLVSFVVSVALAAWFILWWF